MNTFYNKLSLGLILIFGVYTLNLHAQDHSLIQKISLDKQVELSDAIIEGEVISKTSYWDAAHKNIYTSNLIKVYKVFKGETVSETVEIITPGGVVDLKALVVSHSLQLKKGDIGVFMLESSNASKDTESIQGKSMNLKNVFKSVSDVQGFYKYDLLNDKVANTYSKTKSIEDNFYTQITNKSGKQPIEVTAFNLREEIEHNKQAAKTTSISKSSMAVPTITSFSATQYSAGTKSVLTINGTGFGATKGSVGFSDADYGGYLHTDALDNQVLSWTNTQIEVEIPDVAGTGTIKVNTTSNGSIESSNVLPIEFAQINLQYSDTAYQTQHVETDGSGGNTWTMNADFYNSGARDAFIRAFENWSCSTGVNWKIDNQTTAINTNASDGISVITFDNSMGSGTLGQCYSRYQGCYEGAEIKWYVSEMDIVFNATKTWNYTTGVPTPSEIDFESVALHELGHGHQLGHVVDTNVAMHYSLSAGETLRSLNSGDLNGALDVQSRSTTSPVCTQNIMEQSTCYQSSLSNDEFSLEKEIKIYPNPASNRVFVKSSSVNIDNIELYNVLGRLVRRTKIRNQYRLSLDLSDFSAGIYLLKVNTEFASHTQKLIVSK
ncbi:T9SS type A sorting domain-containing protein [Seonamhaeicola sediminis]|uniref:T9SS type A sorting domain-containing protein n=1 Tax=Seonamhaeicola sediminis TaxID=2528206 RepID=A0A562YEW5_9FLAO|nr:T9SS type A sorting domain-containing protein [Seonamhaeicola sediminis]TWO32873.1 T9SS type A sorting domain-containing protein [Seonamhaeicola sediminis]